MEGVTTLGELGRDHRTPCPPQALPCTLWQARGSWVHKGSGCLGTESGTGASAPGVASSSLAWGLISWLPIPDVLQILCALG